MILIGIDVGTTGLKAVALDGAGRLLRERVSRYPTRLRGWAAEQDAEAWWTAARTVLPPVVAGERVLGVAVTSQAPTLAPVDRGGRPTGPALTWIDRRGAAEAEEIARLLGGDPRNPADPSSGTSKLLWAQRHTAHLDQADAALTANGFLVRKLTGESTLDESSAGMLQGWEDGFPPELAAKVPVDLLPPAVPCTTTVGEVTANAAATTGLPPGTPVVAGGIDAVGAALEAGVFAPGDPTVEMTGFSTVAIQAVPRGARFPGLIHTRHCVPGVDLVLAAQNSTGAVLDWLCRTTGVDTTTVVLPRRRPSRVMLLPSFAGDRTPTWQARSRGALVGLDLACAPSDLLLALYEGTALALRECLERMRPRTAPGSGRPSPLRCVGGGARSREWLQVKADVLGHEVEVPAQAHGAAVGAALLAGLGIDHFAGVEQLRPKSRSSRARYLPDPGLHAAYTRRLTSFLALRDALALHDALEPCATELVDDSEGDAR
ncbi:xylulokinase [Longimycelium tulufanense]|nr:FGGY family carbohydrate kinase [Longimycelium tulufanense]